MAECQVVQERYGMSVPALLASEGVFEGRVLAAHAVWLDEADLSLLAEHDVAVAHARAPTGSWVRASPRFERCSTAVPGRPGHGRPGLEDDLHLWDEIRLAPLFARALPAIRTS